MSAPGKDKLNSYTTHQRKDETVRETEARALLSCASRLESARKPESSKEDYASAIKHNQQLWTIFQVCLCEPENKLPQDLKLLLLNLSRYVDKISFRALGEHSPDLLKSLIGINRNIAAGLSMNPQATSVTSERPLPPVPPEQTRPVMTTA